MTLDELNNLGGLGSLFTSLLMVPTLITLRKIVSRHDEKIEDHEGRIVVLEKPRGRGKRRKHAI